MANSSFVSSASVIIPLTFGKEINGYILYIRWYYINSRYINEKMIQIAINGYDEKNIICRLKWIKNGLMQFGMKKLTKQYIM